MTGSAASGEVRGYHNVALLLPDGRVFIAGGRSMGESGPEDEKPSFRYLYPPYLSPRESPPPRPVITAAPPPSATARASRSSSRAARSARWC